LKLQLPDGAADLIDAEIITQVNYVVTETVSLQTIERQAGHTVGSHNLDFFSKRFITNGQHAAFTGRKIFIVVF
jgi:hypothetical protein